VKSSLIGKRSVIYQTKKENKETKTQATKTPNLSDLSFSLRRRIKDVVAEEELHDHLHVSFLSDQQQSVHHFQAVWFFGD